MNPDRFHLCLLPQAPGSPVTEFELKQLLRAWTGDARRMAQVRHLLEQCHPAWVVGRFSDDEVRNQLLYRARAGEIGLIDTGEEQLSGGGSGSSGGSGSGSSGASSSPPSGGESPSSQTTQSDPPPPRPRPAPSPPASVSNVEPAPTTGSTLSRIQPGRASVGVSH